MYLGLLKSFRNTAEVELFNFQDPIQQSDFDSNYIKTQALTLPENVVGNHVSTILEYQFPHRYISTPFKFLKDLSTSA